MLTKLRALENSRYDAYRYSYTAVIVFGIFGNILVIMSILRQKNVLKNNYYFLVLHLAICDLGALIIYVFHNINFQHTGKPIFDLNKFYCSGYYVRFFFQVSGIGMMVMISVLRHRATVHPFKPAISRRIWKLVCGLVYIVAFFAGYLTIVPLCFMGDGNNAYFDLFIGYFIFRFYLCPTIFMAVVYYKIGRALMKQNKYMKSVCSNPTVRRSAPSTSFNILTFIRNRKAFFVCLLTVVCFAIGHITSIVKMILVIAKEHRLLMKYSWIVYCAEVLRVAGSHSVNPLIYGILDKKLLKCWKRRDSRKRR